MKATTLSQLEEEMQKVAARFPEGFGRSHHRAYGVLAEEFIELETELFKRTAERDRDRIRREACQVAVTAIRIMEELG